ncbi:hypothetical protein LXL04_033553 [Taraxacum kok-saghyz]
MLTFLFSLFIARADMTPVPPDQSCQSFTLADIRSATNKFDDNLRIGHGGFADVYKCCRKIGSVISSKRVMPLDGALGCESAPDSAMVAERVVKSEVMNLSSVSHIPKQKKKKSKVVMPNSMVKITPAMLPDDVVEKKVVNLSRRTYKCRFADICQEGEDFNAKFDHEIGYVEEDKTSNLSPQMPNSMQLHLRNAKKQTGIFCNLVVQPNLKLEELNHPNLIRLLGYCLNDRDLFCVYELIPDTSLDKYLHQGGPDTTSVLSWDARLKIAAGAAEGLEFLHQRKHRAYSHFNTTSFILVDTDFNARLSSYELVCPSTTSAFFLYRSPVSCPPPKSSRFRLKSEIYDFGLVLLEILTGSKVYDDVGKPHLVDWAAPILAAEEINLGRLMDPKLEGDYPRAGALKLARLVSECLQPTPKNRPSVKQIVRRLQSIK